MRRIQRLVRSERGDSLVEFAISLVVLLMAIFGIIDCSRALYVYHFVSYAAEEGTRYAIVRGSHWAGTSCASTSTYDCDATGTDVINYVQGLAPPGVTPSSINVNPQWPALNVSGSSNGCTSAANAPGCQVQVQVSTNFSFMLPFFPTSAMTFTSTSTKLVQQ